MWQKYFRVLKKSPERNDPGSSNGTMVRVFTSHPCGPVLTSAWCHIWVEFVLGSCLLQGFISGYSSFPSSPKFNISKFKFDQGRGPTRKPSKADLASSLNHLFIYPTKHKNCAFLKKKLPGIFYAL